MLENHDTNEILRDKFVSAYQTPVINGSNSGKRASHVAARIASVIQTAFPDSVHAASQAHLEALKNSSNPISKISMLFFKHKSSLLSYKDYRSYYQFLNILTQETSQNPDKKSLEWAECEALHHRFMPQSAVKMGARSVAKYNDFFLETQKLMQHESHGTLDAVIDDFLELHTQSLPVFHNKSNRDLFAQEFSNSMIAFLGKKIQPIEAPVDNPFLTINNLLTRKRDGNNLTYKPAVRYALFHDFSQKALTDDTKTSLDKAESDTLLESIKTRFGPSTVVSLPHKINRLYHETARVLKTAQTGESAPLMREFQGIKINHFMSPEVLSLPIPKRGEKHPLPPEGNEILPLKRPKQSSQMKIEEFFFAHDTSEASLDELDLEESDFLKFLERHCDTSLLPDVPKSDDILLDVSMPIAHQSSLEGKNNSYNVRYKTRNLSR